MTASPANPVHEQYPRERRLRRLKAVGPGEAGDGDEPPVEVQKGQRITMFTAYDYPLAVHLDTAGIDICLVGDSASMVVHDHDTTLLITLDEMLVCCHTVAHGAKHPLLVRDLPFGSYESSMQQAIDAAVRISKEGGMDAIKLEGGAPSRITAAKAIVSR